MSRQNPRDLMASAFGNAMGGGYNSAENSSLFPPNMMAIPLGAPPGDDGNQPIAMGNSPIAMGNSPKIMNQSLGDKSLDDSPNMMGDYYRDNIGPPSARGSGRQKVGPPPAQNKGGHGHSGQGNGRHPNARNDWDHDSLPPIGRQHTPVYSRLSAQQDHGQRGGKNDGSGRGRGRERGTDQHDHSASSQDPPNQRGRDRGGPKSNQNRHPYAARGGAGGKQANLKNMVGNPRGKHGSPGRDHNGRDHHRDARSRGRSKEHAQYGGSSGVRESEHGVPEPQYAIRAREQREQREAELRGGSRKSMAEMESLITPRTAQLRKSKSNILPPNADLLHAMVEKVVGIAVRVNGLSQKVSLLNETDEKYTDQIKKLELQMTEIKGSDAQQQEDLRSLNEELKRGKVVNRWLTAHEKVKEHLERGGSAENLDAFPHLNVSSVRKQQLLQLAKLEHAEEGIQDAQLQIRDLNEQVAQLRLELLKEQDERKKEDSWYAVTKKELDRTRKENEELWSTLRSVEHDHQHLLDSINKEVELLGELQQKMEIFDRDRVSQAEQLSDFMGRFNALEQAFINVRGKLAYLLNT